MYLFGSSSVCYQEFYSVALNTREFSVQSQRNIVYGESTLSFIYSKYIRSFNLIKLEKRLDAVVHLYIRSIERILRMLKTIPKISIKSSAYCQN